MHYQEAQCGFQPGFNDWWLFLSHAQEEPVTESKPLSALRLASSIPTILRVPGPLPTDMEVAKTPQPHRVGSPVIEEDKKKEKWKKFSVKWWQGWGTVGPPDVAILQGPSSLVNKDVQT